MWHSSPVAEFGQQIGLARVRGRSYLFAPVQSGSHRIPEPWLIRGWVGNGRKPGQHLENLWESGNMDCVIAKVVKACCSKIAGSFCSEAIKKESTQLFNEFRLVSRFVSLRPGLHRHSVTSAWRGTRQDPLCCFGGTWDFKRH